MEVFRGGFGLGGTKSVLEWEPLVFSVVNRLINLSIGHVCFLGEPEHRLSIFLNNQNAQLDNAAL